MNDDGAITGGPGIPAFLAFFFLVIALWLLMRNMNGRLRRMSYQHKIDDDTQSGGANTSRRKRRPADGTTTDSGATGPDRDKPEDTSDAPSPDQGGHGDSGGGSDGGAGSGGDA